MRSSAVYAAEAIRELAYTLVEKQCTLEDIQRLLRIYKPLNKKDVRVTAENKHDVVARNLRQAVDARLVPFERVLDLIRDSEENGAQHIFFYRPKNSAVAKLTRDGARVSTALWGEDWKAQKSFPRLLDEVPGEPDWCDFRLNDGAGWTAKIYGSGTRYENFGEEKVVGTDPVDGAPIYQRQYKRVQERTVLLVRWLNSGILEIRVPIWSSRKATEKMLATVWDSLSPAINALDFKPWLLTDCCTKMMRESANYQKVYCFSDSILRDSASGTATFSTMSEEETLFSVVERKQAIEAMLLPKKNCCERIAVTFLKQKQTDALSDDLRVIIAAHEQHEIVIGAKTTPAAVDYVVYRLREFS